MPEVEPVYIDDADQPYYFGTPENPFNFRVINEPFRSLEVIALIADGGRFIDKGNVVHEVSGAQDRQRIVEANQLLRQKLSPQLGRLHLESSHPRKPSASHRAA